MKKKLSSLMVGDSVVCSYPWTYHSFVDGDIKTRVYKFNGRRIIKKEIGTAIGIFPKTIVVETNSFGICPFNKNTGKRVSEPYRCWIKTATKKEIGEIIEFNLAFKNAKKFFRDFIDQINKIPEKEMEKTMNALKAVIREEIIAKSQQ